MSTQKKTSSFARDVADGLSIYPKQLSSKYFYDDRGDALFEQIMQLPEYYLTRCERQIIESGQVAEVLPEYPEGLDIIELGAGNGVKTKIFLKQLRKQDISLRYHPVDISAHALEVLEENLLDSLPNLGVRARQGTYEEVLEELDAFSSGPKLILFLGSNIGNLLHPMAVDFLRKISDAMDDRDLLLMGMDLKKDPEIIRAAYDDEEGVTAAFNKNILHRINRELNANFPVNRFRHSPSYNPETGTLKSYLLCEEALDVEIGTLDMQLSFHAWETIHTEISQKYNRPVIEWLAGEAGLEVRNYITDERDYFADVLFGK